MVNIIKLALTLFIVSAVAAGGLAAYNSVTKPVIKKISQKKEDEAKMYVLKGSSNFETVKLNSKGENYFIAKDKDSNILGYIFKAKGQGFSSVVETMVGVDKNFTIKGLKVLKHAETPGLGAETKVVKYGDTRPFFEGWFDNKNAIKVVVEKDDKNSEDRVQSITGATITTRAVCKSINKYAKDVKNSLNKGVK